MKLVVRILAPRVSTLPLSLISNRNSREAGTGRCFEELLLISEKQIEAMDRFTEAVIDNIEWQAIPECA